MASILVADDDLESARQIKSCLAQEGHTATAVHDGAGALRLLLANRYDLLIAELTIPCPGGTPLLARLRELKLEESLPILVVSRQASPVDRSLARQYGAVDHLSKPFDAADLNARVARLAARVRGTAEHTQVLRQEAQCEGVLQALPPSDLCQLLMMTSRSGEIFLDGSEGAGRLTFSWGRLIDATLKDLAGSLTRGEAAALELLRWRSGRFRVRFGPVNSPATIECPTEALLLRSAQSVDEER